MRIALALAAVWLATPLSAQQQLPFGLVISEAAGTSFTLVGSGARAAAMGGAFTAVADDATAASFNPAGLAQLVVPEGSLVLDYGRIQDDYEGFQSFGHAVPRPLSDSAVDFSRVHVNFVSATVPFRLFRKRFSFQISSQRLVDFTYEGRRAFFESEAGGPPMTEVRLESIQSGSIRLHSASLAFEATQRALLGVTLNRWDGSWDLSTFNSERGLEGDAPAEFFTYEQRNTLRGWNVDAGLLLRYQHLNLGFRYRSPFQASYGFDAQLITNLPSALQPLPPTDTTLHWPSSLNAGLALKPSDRWQITADWGRTDWSKLEFELGSGRVNFFDLLQKNETGAGSAETWRAGTEIVFLAGRTVLPVRAGWFREPQPARDRTTGERVVTQGYSAGIGIKRDWFTADLTGVYRTSSTRVARFSEPDEITHQDLVSTSIGTLRRKSLSVYLSFIVQLQKGSWPSRVLRELFVAPSEPVP